MVVETFEHRDSLMKIILAVEGDKNIENNFLHFSFTFSRSYMWLAVININ